jgi:hypothetical protein
MAAAAAVVEPYSEPVGVDVMKHRRAPLLSLLYQRGSECAADTN